VYLQELHVLNFKNHPERSLYFQGRYVMICGKNGCGKTNLLDAVFYLSSGKSYFHHRDEYAILHGENFFTVTGKILASPAEHEIRLSVVREGNENKKNIIRNGRTLRSLSEHVGFFPVTVICPQDNLLIEGGSEERRRFVNEILSQTDPEYFQVLLHYKKILLQRNSYLKSLSGGQSPDSHLLDSYDEDLFTSGTVLIQKRKQWAEDFMPVFQETYRHISGNANESVRIVFRFSAEENTFLQQLKERIRRDAEAGHTTCGPHKDEILFLLNDKLLRTHASQGQQKTFLLSLKLARSLYILNKTGKNAPLLLDDIHDKLDPTRFRMLLEYLNHHPATQIFLTDTDTHRMKNLIQQMQLNAELLDGDAGFSLKEKHTDFHSVFSDVSLK